MTLQKLGFTSVKKGKTSGSHTAFISPRKINGESNTKVTIPISNTKFGTLKQKLKKAGFNYSFINLKRALKSNNPLDFESKDDFDKTEEKQITITLTIPSSYLNMLKKISEEFNASFEWNKIRYSKTGKREVDITILQKYLPKFKEKIQSKFGNSAWFVSS
ncbi:MAG: hypothetical protein ACTSUK_03760 [Promethearchaeota archaeon]